MTIREHAHDERDRHEDLSHIHEALFAAYSEILDDPRHHAEGLDRAACGPHLTHLAALAAAAAAGGTSAAGWRTGVLTEVGTSAADPLDRAETCMRQSGLWPWNA